MKSHFSRFLHNFLSHSNLIGVSRLNKVANLFHLDIRVKPEYDNIGEDVSLKSECDTIGTNATVCHGRSMVEMLGVLAIIGVLSVGAIAGYSKAMMKYKLNKQAEQLNQLVNTVSQYHMQIHSENAISLVPIFKKLNVIPVEMIKDVSDTIYDVFGNEITITSYNYHGFYVANLNYYIDLSNQNNIEVCRNVINTTKENSQSVYYLESIADWGTENAKQKILCGDAYCGDTNRRCINSVSVVDIDNICREYEKSEKAFMKIWWRS